LLACAAYFLAFLVVQFAPLRVAARIDRIDLFDKSDNRLMFVTFDYDASGNNIGRSVFMADSTFVRSTTFQNDVAGNRVRETSFNFNGDTTGYTTFTTVNATRAISVFDQFGLDQLGGPMSAGASGTNAFDVSQKSAVINKIQYQFDAGNNLTRINVLDAGGQLVYYAAVNAANPAVLPMRPIRAHAPAISMIGSRYCRMQLTVDKPSIVRLDAYAPAGRKVATLLSVNCGPGRTDLVADCAVASLPDGIYLFRVSVDGVAVNNQRQAIVGTRGGAR
jgi:hypothetical protein